MIHPSNQDTLTGPKGGRIRRSSLYNNPTPADVDFDSVLKEYERLKSERLLRKQFPRVLPERFREVFYPPPVRMPDSETLWDTNTTSPACTGLVEVERHQNSSAMYQSGM